MNNMIKNKSVTLIGSLAGICLMASMAFANPSMLPDHPGHPMKPLKSPVTGQPLANDPGQSMGMGQKALEAASSSGSEEREMKRRQSSQPIEEEKMMRENEGSEKSTSPMTD